MADAPDGYTVDQPAAVNPETGRLRITVAPLKVNAPVVTGPQTALPEGYAVDPSPPSEGIPPAFLDRVATGSALQKTLNQNGIIGGIKAFGGGFAEGFGGEPIGWSPEHVQQFRDLGIYRDPATGRGGPIRLFNESLMQPIGAVGDLLTRSASGVVHGLSNSFGALIEDAQGRLGNPDEARAEALNFLNERLLRGDTELTRPEDGQTGPRDQVVGPLPRDSDFGSAAKIIGGESTEANLRTLWRENGIHPAEAVADAANDDFFKSQLTAENWDGEGQTPRQAVGAEVTKDFPDMTAQPVHPPGVLQAAVKNAATRLMDWGRELGDNFRMSVVPMATGNTEARAAAKDTANAWRRNRWEWARVDDWLEKTFTPEQRKRMWDASDEESVLRQEGKTSENMGLATLEPQERAAVQALNEAAKLTWAEARDLGMVKGEGLPFWTPRMMLNLSAPAKEGSVALAGPVSRLKTKTANLLRRKYLLAEETEAAGKARLGEAAELARDIRVTPLALARLQDAIAARRLIDTLREIGSKTGENVVSEGINPGGWFTDSEHPAFKTWEQEKQDEPFVFKQSQIYVHPDYAGPLKAILSERNGAIYNSLMTLKGKSMSLIMNSPMIHNLVEFGRAFPAMPGKFLARKVYGVGKMAKENPIIMREAIDAGLVPIGKRFFNQDLSSVMESPNLVPGRSFTSQVLGFIPGLWDEAKGDAVKEAIDKAGDFWHNKLLWDKIANLQMGLYTNFRDDMVAKGVDQLTAQRVAAHLANRFAGSLPQEAMSNSARKIANVFMFSRTFTLGNLGVMKDAFTGLPKDVMAQIERDMGEVNPEAAGYAKALARRKAAMVIFKDMALSIIATSLLQSAMNVLSGDTTLDAESSGYATRFAAAMTRTAENPLEAITPISLLGGAIGSAVGGLPGAAAGGAAGAAISLLHNRVAVQSQNEPGKEDRALMGFAKDGTGIYGRMVFGKIGEELMGYATMPADMLLRKMWGPPRTVWQMIDNVDGFGRPLYEPHPRTSKAMMSVLATGAQKMLESLTPEGQIEAGWQLLTGDKAGDQKTELLQALGPLGGMTFSKGFPGGPETGLEHDVRQHQEYEFGAAIPELRKQILRGDIAGAQQRMDDLHVSRPFQRWVWRSTLNPAARFSARTLREIWQYMTPEERERAEGYRGQIGQ